MSSSAQGNPACPRPKPQWCLLGVTVIHVFLSTPALSQRVARHRLVADWKGQTSRCAEEQFRKVLMSPNVQETRNCVVDAEIPWRQCPSKGETARQGLGNNRLWALGRGSARNGRRAGCRKARHGGVGVRGRNGNCCNRAGWAPKCILKYKPKPP